MCVYVYITDMASKKYPLPRPLVIAGPSGSGKSTLLRKLLQDSPDEFGFSVSREYMDIYMYMYMYHSNSQDFFIKFIRVLYFFHHCFIITIDNYILNL